MRTLSTFFLATIFAMMMVLMTSTTQAYQVGPPAPANINVRSSLFNKIAAMVVPIINANASNIVIPAINSDHFSIDPIHIDNFDLGPIQFAFVAPNEVSVTLSQLSFNMPSTGFELMDKILFVHVHCHGHAEATINIEASFSFKLENNNGKIALDGNTAVNIDYKTLNVGYKMDHLGCKIVSKLINFIVGGITDKIKEAVEKNLAPAIQKALTGALQKAFEKLPFDITGSPSAANQILSLPIDLDSFIKSQQRQSSIERPPRMMSSLLLRKRGVSAGAEDLAVVLPQTSANTVLNTVVGLGKLHFNHTEKKLTTNDLKAFIPGAYTACPDCALNLAVDITPGHAPTVSFQNNNFTLTASNFSLGFGAVNPNTTGVTMPLFTLGVNAGFSVANFSITGTAPEVIHFDLGVQQVQLSVESSQVGKISDVSTIQWLINLVAQTIIPNFNKVFPGVPVPAVPGFALTDIEVSVAGGEFSAGFDVSL